MLTEASTGTETEQPSQAEDLQSQLSSLPDGIKEKLDPWLLAKALYISGLSSNAVARETGLNWHTIRKRAEMERWANLRPNAPIALLSAQQLLAEDKLAEASVATRKALVNDLTTTLSYLGQAKQSKSLDRLGLRAEVQSKLIKNASELFNWKAQSVATTVNIALLSGKGYSGHDGDTVSHPSTARCMTGVRHDVAVIDEPALKESLPGQTHTLE